jgi:hypothetical protein
MICGRLLDVRILGKSIIFLHLGKNGTKKNAKKFMIKRTKVT